MSEPTLDDLRVRSNELIADNGPAAEMLLAKLTHALTPAEFDRIATERDYVNFSDLPEELERRGWVKRPVCGECGGTKKAQCECAHHVPGDTTNGCKLLSPCPPCGGTGFGRLVALDGIDVDALRNLAERLDRATYDDLSTGEIRMLFDLLTDVLAALEGGQEEVHHPQT